MLDCTPYARRQAGSQTYSSSFIMCGFQILQHQPQQSPPIKGIHDPP
ncbi:unnamed protein product, partial [Anisakis simplex]|uniref:Uncharacterized protein n=1 Tax=Anisakis simplex TaxID=6269 RepID=A0A0M3JJZ3_ANISI